MATDKQRQAARKNVRKAAKAAKQQRSLSRMPKATKTALGKQGAAVAQRKRTDGSEPKPARSCTTKRSAAGSSADRRCDGTSSLDPSVRTDPDLTTRAQSSPR